MKHRRTAAETTALLISVLVLLPIATMGARQDDPRIQDELQRYLRSYDILTLDPGEAAASIRQTGYLALETPEGVLELTLVPHDLRSDRYVAEEVLDGGRRRILDPDPVHTYRGVVAGRDGAEARFTLKDAALEGVIITREEWYFLEPRSNYSREADPSELLLYKRSDIRPEAIGSCGTTLAERLGKAQEFVLPRVLLAGGASSVVDIATEADWEYVSALGGSGAANSEILAILNQVEGVYSAELSISFQVVFQNTWNTVNDPYSSSSASGLLSEFRSHWNSNFFSNPYDLAHMWTGRTLDGSTVGIAYLSVVCNARTYSYGVSRRYTSSPGKFVLTAHEIGHNFGGSHPDQANPPQSSCSSSIMNSFISTGLTFCQFSRTEISGHVGSYSGCLLQTPSAPSSLTATALSSTQVSLSWQDNSSSETGFRIERRTGNGPWVVIADTAANTVVYVDGSVVGGNSYTYRVQALGSSGSSPYSNEAAATTAGAAPAITGMLPSSGSVGAAVTITGTNLTGATAVQFNSVTAATFTVASPTQISATVPAGATTGRVRVTTPGGTAQSSFDFVLTSCDINGDGALNVVDVQVLVNVILGASACPGSCDVNRDGRVDVVDLQVLLNIILGIAGCP